MIRKDILVHKTKTLLDDFLNSMHGQRINPGEDFLDKPLGLFFFQALLW